jgi:hypothetical protein
MGLGSEDGISNTSPLLEPSANFHLQSWTKSLSLYSQSLYSWMRLTAFIFTTTETTFQHRLPVTHIVSLEPKWKFWNFKTQYVANHLSPNHNFDGSELLTSWGMQAYQNFENRSDYHILQFFPYEARVAERQRQWHKGSLNSTMSWSIWHGMKNRLPLLETQ